MISELAIMEEQGNVDCEAEMIGKDHKRIKVCGIGEWRVLGQR